MIVTISSEGEDQDESAWADTPDPSDELGSGMEKLSVHGKAKGQMKAVNVFGGALPSIRCT